MHDDTVLDVRGLTTSFQTDHGKIYPVNGVDFSVRRGQTLAIVGESGSGKSVTALSIMRLIPSSNGRIEGGQVLFDGQDVLTLSSREMSKIRGNRIAMIFQEPMTALNPVFTVAQQIGEVLRIHQGLSRSKAREATLELLEKVHIPDPRARLDCYPHELSGGMRQRVMIAMALACNPAILIADEPTTALDVTIQAQVLRLIRELQRDLGTAVLFITHDLGVVAEVADEVAVMYTGRIVERAPVVEIYDNPRHPYTHGLIGSLPRLTDDKSQPLNTISGIVPSLWSLPVGCSFADRCPRVEDRCREEAPQLSRLGVGHDASCHVVADGGTS